MLRLSWPAKQVQVEVAAARLLAEFGLTELLPPQLGFPRTGPMQSVSETVCINLADHVKTRGRNNLVEYFSAAARIPLLNRVNVRCFLEFHLDIPNAGEMKERVQVPYDE